MPKDFGLLLYEVELGCKPERLSVLTVAQQVLIPGGGLNQLQAWFDEEIPQLSHWNVGTADGGL